jgi:hypothetical protein
LQLKAIPISRIARHCSFLIYRKMPSYWIDKYALLVDYTPQNAMRKLYLKVAKPIMAFKQSKSFEDFSDSSRFTARAPAGAFEWVMFTTTAHA